MNKDTPLQVKIRSLMKQYDVSQEVFADLIGASQKSLEYWLAGEREPLESVLILLEVLEYLPVLSVWLEDRYRRVHGKQVRRKGERAEKRKPRKRSIPLCSTPSSRSLYSR